MKKHIPNFITLCNLMSGTIALLMVLDDKPGLAVIFILAAGLFDFLDGTAARMLGASSEIGKQLDSLADIVSFGVVPAAFIYKIIVFQISLEPENSFWAGQLVSGIAPILILIVPAFSAIRLARFNLRNGGDDEFLGLPVPAHALFWTGFYYDVIINGSLYGQAVHYWFTLLIMMALAVMMIISLPMISLKFRNLKLQNNIFRYLTILLALIMLILFQIPGLPMIILIYILLSLVRIVLT